MKYFIYISGEVVGPYLAEEITGLFGGVSPDTLICTAAEFESGRTEWRAIALRPELAGCIKPEIAESLKNNSRGAAGGTGGLKILSTDDDSNIRTLLWHMLTDAGHVVEFARDGEEVFQRLAAKKYDLVILDVNMPKMNGYKVSELIHERLPRPPKVIIFTGRDLEKERLQFVYSGADAILNKGTGNDQLIKTIEGLFSAKPEKAGEPGEIFVPEPTPPDIDKPSPAPITLQKEEFYAPPEPQKPAEQKKPAEPEKPAPRPQPALKTGPVIARAAVPGNQEKPPPTGKPDAACGQLLLDNKALKADLADLRRMLGHIELENTQLSAQLEKHALKIVSENKETVRGLKEEWRELRNFVLRAALLLLAVIAAAFFLAK